MKRFYQVTPRARADLLQIGRFTASCWGKRQRNHYLKGIERRFAWLAENPALGKSRPELGENIRSCPQGAHVIFYIEQQDFIAIIAVLHRQMDPDNHLAF